MRDPAEAAKVCLPWSSNRRGVSPEPRSSDEAGRSRAAIEVVSVTAGRSHRPPTTSRLWFAGHHADVPKQDRHNPPRHNHRRCPRRGPGKRRTRARDPCRRRARGHHAGRRTGYPAVRLTRAASACAQTAQGSSRAAGRTGSEGPRRGGCCQSWRLLFVLATRVVSGHG